MEQSQSEQQVQGQTNCVQGATCSQEYYFHSNPSFPRRYSAAGYVQKNEKGETEVVIAYAVCSEKDQYVKKRGLQIAKGRLRGGKTHTIAVVDTPENESNSRIFAKVASSFAPVTILPRDTQLGYLDELNQSSETEEEATVHNTLINIVIATEEELEEQAKGILQQLTSGTPQFN